jgi:hypothetical protein
MRRLDMRLRLGYAEESGVSRCKGLGTTGFEEAEGKGAAFGLALG